MHRESLPFEQTAYLETIDEMPSRQLAHLIVRYTFSSELTEPSSDNQNPGQMVEQTDAHAVNRMAELIALSRNNEWQSLFAVLGASSTEATTERKWDDSEICLEKLTDPDFIKSQHDLMSVSNQRLLEALDEKLLWHAPVSDDAQCLFNEKKLPRKNDITEAVATYVGMQQRFSNNGMEMMRYMTMANHYRTLGSASKAMLTDRVVNGIRLVSLNLYSLVKIAFSEMIACLRMAQKLPSEEQRDIFGFDLSGCDLDKLLDKDTCDLGEKIGVKCLLDGSFTPCKGFDFFCEYLKDFFGLDESTL